MVLLWMWLDFKIQLHHDLQVALLNAICYWLFPNCCNFCWLFNSTDILSAEISTQIKHVPCTLKPDTFISSECLVTIKSKGEGPRAWDGCYSESHPTWKDSLCLFPTPKSCWLQCQFCTKIMDMLNPQDQQSNCINFSFYLTIELFL